ncbi:MAG: hypothetical protein JSS81_28920 [Acidobacteria bacterium]|nr:hypothetical protein [Acidobacteriota bacterium]
MNLTGTMNNDNEKLLSQIVHLMQTDQSADAPADAVQWSKNLFRSRAAAPKKSVVQRIMAVLQMDLSPDQAAFGERSATASARQLLFAAGDYHIDLRIAASKKGATVSGQIIGEELAATRVGLEGPAGTLATEANEIGEFRFETVAKGVYDLSLTIADREIVVENIEID